MPTLLMPTPTLTEASVIGASSRTPGGWKDRVSARAGFGLVVLAAGYVASYRR